MLCHRVCTEYTGFSHISSTRMLTSVLCKAAQCVVAVVRHRDGTGIDGEGRTYLVNNAQISICNEFKWEREYNTTLPAFKWLTHTSSAHLMKCSCTFLPSLIHCDKGAQQVIDSRGSDTWLCLRLSSVCHSVSYGKVCAVALNHKHHLLSACQSSSSCIHLCCILYHQTTVV